MYHIHKDYDAECKSDYAEDNIIYASIVMSVIFILMIATIIQYFLLQKNEKKETSTKKQTLKDDRIVIFASLLSITFYFICCLCYLIASISLFNSNVDTKSDAETASILFWSFGYGLFQFVLAGRLYFTFKHKNYVC